MPNTPSTQSPKDGFDREAFLGAVGAGKTIETYEKNQKIFGQGDVADTVFFIRKGKVKITVLSEHGKEAVVGIFAEGQFFGEACLDKAELRTSTSHAIGGLPDHVDHERPRCWRPLALSRSFPSFFTAYLLSRNSRIEDDLIDQLFNSSERRLARLLSAAGEIRPGRRRRANCDHPQSGNAGGNDRHHPVAGQLLHEQIQKKGNSSATTEKSRSTVRCWTRFCGISLK